VACSRTTNDPLAGVPRNTAAGRRVADLYRAYVTALGNPSETIVLANALAAAELTVAAEAARSKLLAGAGNADAVVRIENLAARALKRLGIRPNGARAPYVPLRERLAAREPGIAAMVGERMGEAGSAAARPPASLAFFDRLRWIDGRPLLDTIELYRRDLFASALDTYRPDGVPVYNFILSGRAKKNWKTADEVLAALYCLLIRESPNGNACYVLANDEDQAADALDLAKKLVAANLDLGAELETLQKEIRRRDGRGSLAILPARDAIGAHGKTALFVGFDEIHGYRTYDLFEALAPDPTRADALTWVTSYDTIYNVPGVPLYDFKIIGKAGSDPRMLFSWYSGIDCTDPKFADLEPELRANPSIASWPEGRAYLDQQRRRLPTHKFRRLHLNLPGAPTGAFLDQGAVMGAIVAGRGVLSPVPERTYHAFVDMSGGSSDDAVLCIGHKDDGRAVIDILAKQAGEPPFNPRSAVELFVGILRKYRCATVTGDNYAGQTFKQDFESLNVSYRSCPDTKTQLYELLEPALNAGEVELPEIAKLQEQLLTLVIRGARIDHQPGDHDDWANAVAGLVSLVLPRQQMEHFGIFEFYRREVARLDGGGAVAPDFGYSIGAKPPAQPEIRLLPPAGITQVIGMSGTPYMVGADGTITVSKDDAAPLRGLSGWQIEMENA